MKENPFRLSEEEIDDRKLTETASLRWVEDVAPQETAQISYLKSALKIRRAKAGFIIAGAALAILIGRSIMLQIFKHDEYAQAAETNRVRILRIKAARGEIYDRNGIPLTRSVPRFELTLNPLELPRDPTLRDRVLLELAEITGTPREILTTAAQIAVLPVRPVAITPYLTLEEIYPLITRTQHIEGVELAVASAREYQGGPEFSHILGYVGRIAPEEKNQYLTQGYYLDDSVGKAGLELSLEHYLRGRDGRQYTEVDAHGKVQNTLAREDAQGGGKVRLTLDAEFQKFARQSLARGLQAARARSGTLIAMNPQNGEIYALVSLPDYDNNLFTAGGQLTGEIAALFENPDHPLFFRAIAGTYPSGSTIKPAVAAAALKQGIISRATVFFSSGGLTISQWFFPDWKAGGHGATNVVKALVESVNTFFYIIGGGYRDIDGLGIDALAEALRGFGFGARTGVEFYEEAEGLVPTPRWKEEAKGERWYIGDTYHLAIGQGDILVTPLQIARMTAYFASGGKWTRPHVVLDPDLENLVAAGSFASRDLECCGKDGGPQIDPADIAIVRQGLRDAVRFGSARGLDALTVSSAGKTGTAQWSSVNPPHAWFTGWAPYNDAQIVVTVIEEEGGEGSAAAVPVAKEVLQWWFQNRQ